MGVAAIEWEEPKNFYSLFHIISFKSNTLFPSLLPLVEGHGEVTQGHHPHDPLLPILDISDRAEVITSEPLFDLREQPEISWSEVWAVGGGAPG